MASKVNAHDDRPHLSQRFASLGGAYASHSVATQCRDAMIEEGITSTFLMDLDGMGVIEPELTVRISVFTKPFQLSL